MNKTLVTLGISLGLMGAANLRADVIVTEPVGGNDVSTDKAVNSTNGAGYVALGNIVLTEGAASDFGPGNGQTLILTAPDGWRLNTAPGASVSFLNSRDITAASVALTTSNITVTFSVGGTTKLDQLTISGVQVQPLNGATDPNAGYIVNLSANPGTASIAGIQPDLTTFGLLNTDPGKPVALEILTQPSTVAMAGVPFSVQPVVMTYDQFGNQCFLDVNTVVNASRADGIGTLQGTTNFSVVGGECSFTNLSHNVANSISIFFTASNLTSVTSQPIVVGPAAATQLIFTKQPGAAVSGAPFGQQPALKSQDQFGNDSTVGLPASQNVTLTLSAGTGVLVGDTNEDIGTNAGNGIAAYTNLELDAAGNSKQLTASSSGFSNQLSALFNVTGGGFSSLLVVVPGETFTPGTLTGKAGTPVSQFGGSTFNVTVYAVDGNWNLINTVTDVVSFASSDDSASLPANAPLVNGSRTFQVTLNTIGSATVTAGDATDNTKSPGTSTAIQVTGLPARLTLQTQPSSTATAGTVFSQQPVIRIEDASGNLISSDNGRVITATRGTGTAALQGTVTASTVNGVATFTSLSYNVAETITVTLSATGLTNATSAGVVVNPATADRLIFSIQPGGVSRVGSILATQPCIKSRDPFGNLSTVGLPPNLPVSVTLSSGSGSLTGSTVFDIGTAAGNGAVLFTNLGCATAGTNKQLTGSATGLTSALSTSFLVGGFEPISGLGTISADTAGGAYTTLAGPAYYEAASGDAGAGTVVLNSPAGFSFDTGGTAPTVIVQRLGGSGGNTSNMDGVAGGTAVAIASRATNQITLTVTNASTAGVTCSLTWTNVRVRPNAGTPLASGNITATGTASLAAVAAGVTSLGSLTEVAGLANRFVFTTQPGSATAGAPFGSQPVIKTRDQFGNDSTTGLPASRVMSLALTSGTGPLLGTANVDVGTAGGNGVATLTNLEIDVAGTNKQLTASASGFTNATSTAFNVSAAAASRLTISSQPSATATAGVALAQQPVVRIEDAFGNLMSSDNSTTVTVSRGLGTGTLQGTLSRMAFNGLVTFTNLSYNVAETINLAFTSGSLSAISSSNTVISPAAANRLTIQTQPGTSASAGVIFSPQPVIRIEDQFGNLRNGDNTTVIIATRSGGSGSLQGTTNRTAVSGVVTFTNLSHTVATNITIAFTSGTLSNAISSVISVSPAAANHLKIQTQPSLTATAGVAFAQQPVIRIEDQFGNLRNADTTSMVTAARNAGGGTLQGTTNLAAINGVVSFTNLSHSLVTNITINFATTGLPTVTSSNIVINAGAFTKLQLLAPGETAAPGTATGKTGSPSPQTAGGAFSVTVNAVDANWNRITNVTDTIAISASDINAVLPANAALASGTKTFSVTLKTAPSQTVTASDVTQPSKTANSSPAISVNPAAATRLTVQSQPSATATAGIAFSQQPVIRIEDQFGNLRNADTGTAVTAARAGGSGTLQGATNLTAINGVVTFTNLSHNVATNITIQFTSGTLSNVTSATIAVSAGAANRLTIATQPSSSATAGVNFAQQPVLRIEDQFGNLRSTDNSTLVTATRNTGTSSLQGNTTVNASGGLAAFSNLSYNTAETITVAFNSGSLTGATSGNIAVSPASASKLTIQRQPSSNATAGVPFAQQPIVRVEDAFGNLRSTDNSTVVSAARSFGSGILQGATNLTAVNGVVTFTNLSHNVATNITVGFGSGSLAGATSGTILIAPAAANRLVFSAQPGLATAGAPFAMQPSVKTQDQFGNDSTMSLAGSLPVTMALSAGSGPLLGTTSLDIGTNAGNGLVAFTDLEINIAGTNKQLSASASGLSNALSSVFSVAAASAARLTLQTQPSATATAGVALTQQPVIRIEDPFGNLMSSDNSTVVTVSLGLGSAALQGTLSRTALNGVVTFTNLSYNIAETINLTFSSGGLTGTASSNVVVSAAAANRLTILTQPGATAVAGTAFGPQPVVRIEDQFGNLRSSDNSTVVSATRGAGSGTLLGNTNTTAANGMVTFTNLAHGVATNITIQFASGTLAGTTSSSIAVSVAAAARLTIQTQPSVSATAGVAFAQQPVVRVEDSYGNLVAADNATTVTAARANGSGTLQGTVTASAVNGLVNFTNLSHTVATNITIQFTGAGLASVTSSVVGVSPGAAAQLTILTQPLSTAMAGVSFSQSPQVRIEDTYGNLRASDNSTVISVARGLGSGSLQGNTTATASGGVATFTNLSYTIAETINLSFTSGSLTGTTSGNVVVSAAAANKLTILTQPSSTATAGVVFAQQPSVRIEDQFGNLRSGDNSTVVTAARAAGSGTLQGTSSMAAINGIITFTDLAHNIATNITIAFTSGSLSGTTSSVVALSPAVASKLTIKTQPSATVTAGAAFAQQPVVRVEDAFGNLVTSDNSTLVTAARNLGSGIVQGTTALSSSGGLVSFTNLSYAVAETMNVSFSSANLAPAISSNVVVNPAAASRLTILAQPSTTAAAGVIFAQQPVVRIEDQFGNLRSSDNSTVVSAARALGSGLLQGTTNLTAVNGVVTFTNLSHRVATNITISFGSGSLAGATSAGIQVSPAPANHLVFAAQPGLAIAGAAFGSQPAVKTQDQFGNDSTMSLAGSLPVTMALSAGSGPLIGTISLDIGTNAGNGLVAFADLEIDIAGTNKQLSASAGGLSNALSSVFSVAAATAARLTLQTQPSAAATAGVALTQQPVIRIEDPFGNLMSSDNSTVVTVSLGLGSAALQGTLSRMAVNGVVTFTNLSYNIAETINLTFSSGSLTGTASSNVVVSAAAANRLTILTQPGPTAVAGMAFGPQPVVRIEDQFGNLRSSDNSTVVTATRGAGSGTLLGNTNATAANGMVTFTNLAHGVATNITIQFASGTLAGTTSSSIAVSVAAAARLTIQTQPSVSATAGVAFAQQPVVRVEDSYGNLVAADNATTVTAARANGSGTLQGTVTASAVNGLVNFTNLSHTVATNITIQFSSGSLGGVTSANVTVNPAAASRLMVLTQPPGTVTAGAAFSPPPQVRIEDAFGNLRVSDNSTVINAARSQGSGSLQGNTAATAIGGVATFTNLSYTMAETINLSFTSGSLTGATSGNVVVSAAAASKLTILTQPSSTATAGVAFAQQPVIRIEDQFGNLRGSDNSTIVMAARASGTGTLQGTTTASASGGVASFSNLSYLVAETMKIAFSSASLTNVISGNVVVSAGPFAKLQLLAPGETAAPGTVGGKSGTPTAQSAFTGVPLTVNAVDANWNRVNAVTDTVGITSSDTTATLPANAALIAGTQSLPVFFGTNGNFTVTATDLSDGSKTASISPAITVNLPQFAPATGGTAISADSTGGTFTALTGPTYTENASGNVGTGTVILKAPSGFIFDTGGTAPTVRIDRLIGSGSSANNINGVSGGVSVAMTSVTTTQLVFTVTSSSASGITCKLTWQNVRVRPSAGTPLASSNLVVTGTASVLGVSTNSNFGALREIAGVANRVAIQTQPSPTATAGMAFAQQPVVQVQDQFGNLRSAANSGGAGDNSTVVIAARNAGSGVLQGTTSLTAVGGLVTYASLSHNVATNITITFSSGSLTSTTSSAISVAPSAANHLVFSTQPGNATAGAPFATQPALKSQDSFGNNSAVGLPASRNVTVALSSGTGPLQGTTALDIGTAAGNGSVAFTDLRLDTSGTNRQLTVSATGLSNAVSGLFTVNPAAPGSLGFVQQPTSATAGAVLSPAVTVRLLDNFGNPLSGAVVAIGLSSGTGTLSGTLARTTDANGIATFNDLSLALAGTKKLAAASGALSTGDSSAFDISPATAARLTLLTQPSPTATAGVTFVQQPVVRIEDQFGNLVASDVTTTVSATRSAGSGPLQGTTSLKAINGVISFTNLSHNVATNITIAFTSGSLSSVTSGVVAVSPAVASRLTMKTQPSASATAGAAFAQQPVVRIEDSFGNLIVNDSSSAVTAARNLGTGTLQGAATATANGGVAAFTNLSYSVAETINISFGSGSLTAATSSNVVVSPAAASQLIILTQPSSTATAGLLFGLQPVIRIEDQYGNLRSSDNTTVVSASRGAGSGVLQGSTNVTAIGGVVTFKNLSHNIATNITIQFASGSLGGATSTSIAISPATASRLGMQTQPSSVATAGVIFAQQPLVRIEDAFGNLISSDSSTVVTAARAVGPGTLQGTVTASAVNGLASFTNLSHTVATNITIQFTGGGLANATSSVVTVSPAAAAQLTMLTQPPATATAGAVFGPQPQVRIEDIFGNLRSSDNSTVVSAARSLGSGSLQGTAVATASGGVASFTNLSYAVAETMNVSFTSVSLVSATSSNVVVSPAAASKLTILMQPSSVATAGVIFDQQPTLRIEDSYGNLRSGDNTTIITAMRSAGAGVLQGSTNMAAINGIVAFTNFSHNVATNITIAFTSGSLSAATSSVVVVSPAVASKLTIKTQPSASATAGVAFAQQPVVRIEDGFGNLVTSDNSTVVSATRNLGNGAIQGTVSTIASAGLVNFTNLSYAVAETMNVSFTGGSLTPSISSNVVVSAAAASRLTILTQPSTTATAGVVFAQQPSVRIEDQFGNLRASDSTTVITAARAGGSGTLQGTLTATVASGVATFTNLLHSVATNITIQFNSGTLAGASSGLITVTPAAANRLTIASQPSASATAGVIFAQQPVVRIEDQFGNLRSGDNSTVVTAARAAGSGTLQGTTSLAAANGVVAFANLSHNVATNITITFTGSGLASATSSTIAVSTGPADHLTIQTQPSTSATAGVVFAQQPKVRIEDAFGNLISSDNSTVITAARNAGSGTLQGTVTATAVSGVASFTNLSHQVANTITIGFSNGGLVGTVSSNILINPASVTRLGFTTQPGAAIAGSVFGMQPAVNSQDQFGNNSTVGLSSNRTVTLTLTSGTGPLQGTTSLDIGTNAGKGLALFTNLRIDLTGTKQLTATSTNLTNAVSSSFVVSSATASRLTIQTQPSSTATAGLAFIQQPVVRIEDSLGNLLASDNSTMVTAARSGGAGTLQGTLTVTAINGLASFTNLSHLVATNITIQFSSGSLASATSSNITVSPAAASRLTISTQPSSTAIAGTVFSPAPQLRIEDAFGNLRSGDNSTVVSAARSLGSASLQGTTNVTASGGIASFSNLSYTLAETMNVAFSASGLSGATCSNVIVNPAAASRLTVAIQPSSTAIAGTVFAQQPSARIEDQYGNLRSTDNATLVTATRSAGSGTLQGTTSRTATGGIASFSDLSYPVAETMTMLFSGSGLASSTSTAVTVNTGPFKKLLVLAPGETAAPGTPNGKSGTPSVQSPDTAFNLTINAVDDNWNVVNSITDMVGLTSSDLQAALPSTVALVAGTKQISAVFSTPGTNTIGATDLSDGSKLPAISSGIPIVARFSSATGGTTISADTTGAAFTSLTGPSYSENASGDAGVGTVILNAPIGFAFDTGGTSPTVRIDRIAGNGTDSKNINAVATGSVIGLTSVSSTQLVFTITIASASGNFCKLTWQNVRVRPTAGIPLAFNKLTRSGTSILAGVTNGVSNFGTLREVAGAANRLALQTQPSTTATAGVAFVQQPIIEVRDQFGNVCCSANGNSDNGRIVTALRLAGAGTLQGQTNVVVADGRATFTDLYQTLATNITVGFSSGILFGTTSIMIAIAPGPATQLLFASQPSAGTVGMPLSPPPLVCTCDAFGNKSAVGLPATKPLSIWLSTGAGSLLGTTTGDIGLSAGNGLVSFTNLMVDAAGNKQFSASADGLGSTSSSAFTVAKGNQTVSFDALGNKTYGCPSFHLSAAASSGLPVSFAILSGPANLSGDLVTILGSGTVSIRAAQTGDSNWNAATPVDQGLNVAKATLTVTADNQSRVYGAPNPTFTASYSGFVNGEDASVSSGTPQLSTTATATSSVPGSPYAIVGAIGSLSAANYDFAFMNGQLSISPASSFAAVASSANPACTGSNVTFIATVTAVAPGSGNPNGTVQFKSDGSAIGLAATVSNGIASISSSSLTHGTHQITAEYCGDQNFLPSTNSLGTSQTVNLAPTALLASYQRQFGSALQIPIQDLLTNFTTDADGDVLTLLSVGAGTNGATISISGGTIWYQPSDTDPNRNTTDYFDYSISDGYSGGIATTKIRIDLTGPDPSSQPPWLSGIKLVSGNVMLTFTGIAGYAYHIERAPSVTINGSGWTDIGSMATDGAGNAQFTDTSPIPGRGFYRVVWKP